METLDFIYDPGVLKVLGRDTPVSRVELEFILQKREIVYLKLADLSYNQIIEYFKNIHGIFLTKYHIASVVREAGRRARFLNGIFDARVSKHIKVLEIDEIFQGRLNCYLGVVDKSSHYLLLFTRLEDRSIESFMKMLEPLVEDLEQIELVITDALAAYKSVIPGIFDGVIHVLCHVHGYRVFLKEGDKINRAAKKAATDLADVREDIKKLKQDLRLKKRRFHRFEKRLSLNEMKRQAFLVAHGIKKYSKTKKFSAQRQSFNFKANYLRSSIRSLKNTLISLEKRIKEKIVDLSRLELEYAEKKQEALQSGRIIAAFHHLLDCPSGGFEAELARYIAMLDRSKYPIAQKVKKFIKNNPAIYATNLPSAKVSIPLNHINTNTAEGTFSISRPVLNKAKHFFDSEESGALLEIFRFRFNMSPPYTGPNKYSSPLERAGVDSSFSTWVEALFPISGRPVQLVHPDQGVGIGPNMQEAPSMDVFRENLARYKHASRNLADQHPKRGKPKRDKNKRR